MEFSLVPIADKKFLNFIYLGLASSGKSLIALFNTRGNTMIKQSIADSLNLEYIDQTYIDEKRSYRRAYLSDLLIGGLKLEKVPVIVGKDALFDIGKDPQGNTNDCDMVLGWNVISNFAWRGDIRAGKFEVQTSDFKKNNGKMTNQPLINIMFEGQILRAAIDTSRPFTIVSTDIAKKAIDADKDTKQTLDLMGEDPYNLTSINKFVFTNDNKQITLRAVHIDASLDDTDIKIVFGADLLRATKWAIFGPMKYVRMENY